MEEVLKLLLNQSAGVIVAVLLIWRLDQSLTTLVGKVDELVNVIRLAPPHSH